MNLINFIVIFLLILPIFWFITDFKEGKIKNLFIFPSLVFLLVLSFFIEWFFFSIDNWISFFIILFFSFLFYRDNKWWAWDGKYLILLGHSTIIIGYLKWLNALVIKLFIFTFLFFVVYCIFYLLFNYNKIKKIKFKTEKLDYFNYFYSVFLLFLLSFLFWYFLPQNYSFIIVFLLMILVLPFFEKIKLIYFKISIIIVWFVIVFYYSLFLNFILMTVLFFLFKLLSFYLWQIFDIIDVKCIELWNLKQWQILTNSAIKKIKNDIWIELYLSPIQWSEVYDIISYYNAKNLLKEQILVYNDIKIGFFIYLWYLFTVFTIFLNK